MTLPISPNPISMAQVSVELGLASNTLKSLNDSNVRTLLGKPTNLSTISLSDAWGKTFSTNQYSGNMTVGFGQDTSQWYGAGIVYDVNVINDTYTTNQVGVLSPATINGYQIAWIGATDERWIGGNITDVSFSVVGVYTGPAITKVKIGTLSWVNLTNPHQVTTQPIGLPYALPTWTTWDIDPARWTEIADYLLSQYDYYTGIGQTIPLQFA